MPTSGGKPTVSRPSPLEPRFMGTKLRRLSGGPFPTSSIMNKSAPEIRREVRHYLNQLSAQEREQLTHDAIDQFLATPEYRRCKYLAAFYPVRHELDLMPLIDQCWSDGKKVFLYKASDGIIIERIIEKGISNWAYTEVLSGLKEGDQIVVNVDIAGVEDGATAVISQDEE